MCEHIGLIVRLVVSVLHVGVVRSVIVVVIVRVVLHNALCVVVVVVVVVLDMVCHYCYHRYCCSSVRYLYYSSSCRYCSVCSLGCTCVLLFLLSWLWCSSC